ncbi:GH25016 [Drosophila grimshawi]|uniref:Adenosine 5'-monophosphoramidase HINT3 n=1 Tax=Drosophila grimshawi TaxID=7222 RepID=B4JZ97_DROGR|nr:GH25016 [Drosophila grimshawi]
MKKRYLFLFPLFGLLLILIVKYSTETGNDLDAQSLSECLFCKIAKGTFSTTKLEFEDEEFVIFKDKNPAAKIHYLAVPKQHYDSIKALNKSHIGLIERMQNGMINFLKSKDVDLSVAVIGYHVPPFISQKHLHLHGISPVSEMSVSNRISFFMPSFWFKSSQDVLRSLQRSDLK